MKYQALMVLTMKEKIAQMYPSAALVLKRLTWGFWHKTLSLKYRLEVNSVNPDQSALVGAV